VRREAHGVGQLALENGAVDDPRQFADALLPGREVDAGTGRITFDVHVMHGGRGMRGQGIPHLEPLEQRDRHRVEGIRPHVLGRSRTRRAGGRGRQGHLQALPRERERQALPDDPRTTHAHVETLHRRRL